MGYYEESEELSVVKQVNPIGYGISYKIPITSEGELNIITGIERIIQSIGEILDTMVGSRFEFCVKFDCKMF